MNFVWSLFKLDEKKKQTKARARTRFAKYIHWTRTNVARMQERFDDGLHPQSRYRVVSRSLYLVDDCIRTSRNEIHRDGYSRHPAVDTMLHAHVYTRTNIAACNGISAARPRHIDKRRFRAIIGASMPGFARVSARASYKYCANSSVDSKIELPTSVVLDAGAENANAFCVHITHRAQGRRRARERKRRLSTVFVCTRETASWMNQRESRREIRYFRRDCSIDRLSCTRSRWISGSLWFTVGIHIYIFFFSLFLLNNVLYGMYSRLFNLI